MSQVVRVNATDRRIKYFSPYWANNDDTLVLDGESRFLFYVSRFGLCLMHQFLFISALISQSLFRYQHQNVWQASLQLNR